MRRLVLGLLALVAGCGGTLQSNTQTAFSVADTACAMLAVAGASIPVGTPVAVVVADIELVCPELKNAEALVLAIEGQQADAGTGPSGPYVPSPAMLAARARKGHK